jgi:hypothetical protein
MAQMKYCRIDLSKTDYQKRADSRYIIHENFFPEMFEIYRKYCEYKRFDSVMPLFEQQFRDTTTEIIGYFNNRKLAAFSLIKLYDKDHAEAIQFAWDYADPKLRLGIESLKNECAVYKDRGFKYLYLGSADEYKSQLDGFEILGPL